MVDSLIYRNSVYYRLSGPEKQSVTFEPHWSRAARAENAANGTQFYTVAYQCSKDAWNSGNPFAKVDNGQ